MQSRNFSPNTNLHEMNSMALIATTSNGTAYNRVNHNLVEMMERNDPSAETGVSTIDVNTTAEQLTALTTPKEGMQEKKDPFYVPPVSSNM